MTSRISRALRNEAERNKARLIDALPELGGEARHIYSDQEITFEFKVQFSLIANITPQSFLYNGNKVLGNTFTERCPVVHRALADEEKSEAELE